MADTYWYKQSAEKPLFPDLLWARPENKRLAGKLLIIGGNKFGFAAPAAAFAAAGQAGVGSCRILLPEALRKIIGDKLPEADFAPSNLSGSFSQAALGQLLESADWADGVLLAGDFGRNSETAILLEKFLNRYKDQITISQDGLDYFLAGNSLLLERARTTAVINLGKLQKLAKYNRPSTPVLNGQSLHELVRLLHEWTADSAGAIITKHAGQFITAIGGRVTTTIAKKENWQTDLAAYVSVWRLQQPSKIFAALATALYDYQRS